MNRTTRLIAATTVACLSLAACSSTPRAGEIDVASLERAPFIGTWTSELDGATLTIEPTGIFSIDVPARAAAAAHAAVGRWSFDEEALSVTFTNLSASSGCADIPGTYAVEATEEAVRLTKVKDNCPAREEHMAWGWKKASTKAERSGA